MTRLRAFLLVTALTSAFLTTSASSTPTCPAPKTCPAYALADMRWPSKPGQPVVIPYYVSTTLDPPLFKGTDLPPVVAAATRVWEKANPRIRFRYLGTTDTITVGYLTDGMNVIGFGIPQGAPGLETADAEMHFTQAGTLYEADINLDFSGTWVWDPCRQQDGGCAGHSRNLLPVGEVWSVELQGVLEHELGHWLSLDHPDSTTGTEMTMYESGQVQNLAEQTLGLGDILGVRAAYPCGKCGGKPRVYAP